MMVLVTSIVYSDGYGVIVIVRRVLSSTFEYQLLVEFDDSSCYLTATAESDSEQFLDNFT